MIRLVSLLDSANPAVDLSLNRVVSITQPLTGYNGLYLIGARIRAGVTASGWSPYSTSDVYPVDSTAYLLQVGAAIIMYGHPHVSSKPVVHQPQLINNQDIVVAFCMNKLAAAPQNCDLRVNLDLLIGDQTDFYEPLPLHLQQMFYT